jgi:alpha-tubulin suppressor-like RCC1 family protein
VCARLRTGQARCWGDNFWGQLGDGTENGSLRPVVVENASGTGPLMAVRRISLGTSHGCALRTDGTARCWGDNNGKLGNGAEALSFRPVGVVNPSATGLLTGIEEIHAADTHTCARLANRQVRCWGSNAQGQLGVGVISSTPRVRPAAVRNENDSGVLRDVTQLHTGDTHACVRLATGQARCWGDNAFGKLGNAETVDFPLPVAVAAPPSS